jgi:glycosyltransferase involved in cell wall biosynthesis
LGTPLQVLQLLPAFTIGGAELLAVNLAGALHQDQYVSHVAALFEREQNALSAELHAPNIRPHSFRGARLYSPTLWRNVARYVQKHQIDIIHTHLLPADIVGRFVGRIVGVPVVSTIHSVPAGFKRARADRYWLERISALYLSDQLVTVAHYVRKLFEQEWQLKPNQLKVIYNAVPIERYNTIPEPSLRSEIKPDPIILAVGRLIPDKAYDLLLEAAHQILARHPGAQFRFVGQGTELAALQAQAQRLGIEQQVQFLGMRRDIPQLLAECDIFVLPSHREGLPLSVVEAMAAARPVIITDVGGNRELVTHNENGIIIAPGNANLLATALTDLLEHPERWNLLGSAGRRRILQHFTMETMVQQYQAIYNRLAKAR